MYKYSLSDSDWSSLCSKRLLFWIVLPALSLTTVAAGGQKQISHRQNCLESYTGSWWLKLPSGLTVWLVKHIYTRWLHSHCSSTCTAEIFPPHMWHIRFLSERCEHQKLHLVSCSHRSYGHVRNYIWQHADVSLNSEFTMSLRHLWYVWLHCSFFEQCVRT